MAPALDGSDVASVAIGSYECRVYYQDTEGFIREHIHRIDGWKVSSIPAIKAKPASPLAVVGWNSGNQIRLYCVSVEGYLQEWCYSPDQDRWEPGYLTDSKFPVAAASKLAAVCWYKDAASIRVYAQDPENRIMEYANGAPWTKRPVGPEAQVGSSLAAVCWEENGTRIRVYYHATDQAIREQCSNEEGKWFTGEFSVPNMPPYTAIAAVAWPGSTTPIRVYFQDSSNAIAEMKHDQTWSRDGTVVGPLRPGRRLAALYWEGGTELRVYYQADDNKMKEMARSQNSTWFTGEFVS